MKLNLPHNFFLLTALLFGLTYAFLVPPFQVPDEENHFEYAYWISEGHLSGMHKDKRLGGEIPSSIGDLSGVFRPLRFHYEEKSTPLRRSIAGKIKLRPERKKFADFANTGMYAPTAYLPLITAISIGKILDARPLVLLYGARVFTLLFWIFLVYHSVKIMPESKWLWVVCALLPASLFINSGAGADVVTNACAFLLTAVFLRLILDKNSELNALYIALMFVLSGVIALNKFVYSPFIGLSLLIPTSKFGSRNKPPFASRSRLLFIGSLFICNVVIVVLWYLHSKALFIPFDEYNQAFRQGQTLNPGVAPTEQLNYVIHHPFEFFKTLSLSWIESAPATLAHYLGKFGWEKNYLPAPLLLLSLLTLTLSTIKRRNTQVNQQLRVLGALICFTVFIALSLTLYMLWSPLENERIRGLAGRYLFPFIPLLLFLVPGILKISNERFSLLLKLGIWLPLLGGIWAVYERYYLI